MSLSLSGEEAMLAFAKAVAPIFASGGLIFLEGTLGAGKTTFSRGVIQALGYAGAVKSPTYTLVEDYDLAGLKVCHFDLYRLASPEELEFIGIRDYLDQQALCLVEWAEKGAGVLPAPDLILKINDFGVGRELSFTAHTEKGQRWASEIARLIPKWESA